jgi:hypothetical protein
MNFDQVKTFIESWGLTPENEWLTLPYPTVYQRMRDDATKQYGEKFSKFLGRITETTDSQSYLTDDSWESVEESWEEYMVENP